MARSALETLQALATPSPEETLAQLAGTPSPSAVKTLMKIAKPEVSFTDRALMKIGDFLGLHKDISPLEAGIRGGLLPISWPFEAEQVGERMIGKAVTGQPVPITSHLAGEAALTIGQTHPRLGAVTGAVLETVAPTAVLGAAGTIGKTLAQVMGKAPIKLTPQAVTAAFPPLTPKEQTTGLIREHAAQLAQRKEQAFAALESSEKFFKTTTTATNLAFIDAMEAGTKTTPQAQPVADALRTLLDKKRDEVRALGTGALEQWKENYFPHIWERPNEHAIAALIGKRPLKGPAGFLKQRVIPTTAEGVALGLKPVTDNPVTLALLKVHEMDRFIMGNKILKEMQETGLAKVLQNAKDAPVGWVPINQKIAMTKGVAYAPKEAAEVLNRYLSPGLGGNALYQGVRAASNTMNAAQLGMSAFHLGFTSLDAATSQMAVGLQQLSRGQLVKGLKNVAGGNIVTAPIQTFLKGNKVLKEYLSPGSQGEEMGRIVNALIQGGGRVKMDSFYKNSASAKFWQAWREGSYGKVGLRALPAAIEQTARPIMEYLVPRQKLGVFFDLAQEELRRMGPHASSAQLRQVLGKAWDSVDNRMGQMVYDNLFWNKTLKDLGMLSTRAMGWNLGTIRELGGAGVDLAKIVSGKAPKELTARMAYVPALAVTTALHGAMYQYLKTGKRPETMKDYFFPRNGKRDPLTGEEERVSLPSYVKDVVAYATHPIRTIGHKVNPLASALFELLNNENYRKDPIYLKTDPFLSQVKDVMNDVTMRYVPFSFQNLERQVGPESFAGVVRANREIEQNADTTKALQAQRDQRARQRRLKNPPPSPIDTLLSLVGKK